MERWIKGTGWLKDGVCDQRVGGQTYDGCEQGGGKRYLWGELGQRKRASTVDSRCSFRRHRLLRLCPSAAVARDDDRQPLRQSSPIGVCRRSFRFPSSKSLPASSCKEAPGQRRLPPDLQVPRLPAFSTRSTHRLKCSTRSTVVYFVLLISGDAYPPSMIWRGMSTRLP